MYSYAVLTWLVNAVSAFAVLQLSGAVRSGGCGTPVFVAALLAALEYAGIWLFFRGIGPVPVGYVAASGLYVLVSWVFFVNGLKVASELLDALQFDSFGELLGAGLAIAGIGTLGNTAWGFLL